MPTPLPFMYVQTDENGRTPTTGQEMEGAWTHNFDLINACLTEIDSKLKDLSYKPWEITNFEPNLGNEWGSIVQLINFRWDLTQGTEQLVSQSINNISAPLDINDRFFAFSGNISSPLPFTLTINDGKTTKNKSVLIDFLHSRYSGTSDFSSLMDSQIITELSGELSENFLQTKTFNCTGGKYIYFAFPKSFGIPKWIVGGYNYSAMQAIDYLYFTNAHNYPVPLTVYRTQDIQYGSSITVQVTN